MMNEWKPIETAPRDGSWFVAVRAGEPDSYEVGSYDPMHWPEYEPVEGGLYRKIVRLSSEWSGFNNMHRMTHWMSLPEPPSEVTP